MQAVKVAIVVEVVSSIWGDMADDYYGTQEGALAIQSNSVSEVHRLHGHIVGNTYVVDPQTLRFYGALVSLQPVFLTG